MFLGTVGITEGQVLTASKKVDDQGVMEKKRRSGRSTTREESDRRVRDEIKAHINRFSKMESLFCLSSYSHQYLYSELTLATMYDMYKEGHPTEASRFLYSQVFHSLKLKFHIPKKDQCGVWATKEEKEEFRTDFDRHTAEKIDC
ncbi:hypothetical protein HOLleu_31346 [Holothuria leucospilota]|uniref:Uncharacterized protein n=1 Tax=Holothuria leucospilota TaxID=206669 RepID=A0A9Q0YQ94_HOLLE|nr:hypothetical protein HOLleu_31346 [Holothuria leucospilota]